MSRSLRDVAYGTRPVVVLVVAIAVSPALSAVQASEHDGGLRRQARDAVAASARYFHQNVAVHGGYVYYYSLDLKQRWGEGPASRTQVWVQPPGTPSVGLAFLKAFDATGDPFFLQAATDAAESLVYGQLRSGGWTNMIDFDPKGRVADYRNGRGRGKNNSSLDDGQSQSAIRLLVRVDKARGFRHRAIHESASIALDALLEAQFQNGGFPQVWTGPTESRPVMRAGFPDYDWRSEGRIKEYWSMYTLNDNVPGYVAEALIDAYDVYQDERYRTALERLGDFLLLAQMPAPQSAWAQQYNKRMQPIWARKFEPPAIAGDESQEVIETLLRIHDQTGDRKFIEPIPRALAYLEQSLLPDGRLARYYELKTNRPLYMARRGNVYSLTYDDSRLPSHYGWKIDSRITELTQAYDRACNSNAELLEHRQASELVASVRRILAELDAQNRWLSVYRGERLVGQPKFELGSRYLSSEVFSRNLETLSEYLIAAHD